MVNINRKTKECDLWGKCGGLLESLQKSVSHENMFNVIMLLTPESFITVVVGEYMSLFEGEHSGNPSSSFLICVIPPGETSPGTAVSVIIDTCSNS